MTTSPVPPIQSKTPTWKTPELVVDTVGNLFAKTSFEVSVDGQRAIVVMDAEQAELILKLLRVVDYAD